MKTLEECFIREFKREVRLLGNKDVYSIPLPKEVEAWDVSGAEKYRVFGVETEHFSQLNDKIVKRIPKGYEARRRVIDKVNRSYKRDKEGNFVYEKYQVPAGSTVVTSTINLSLPYNVYVNPPKGFGYIDFINGKNGTEFIYVIPNEYLYKIHQTALALSVKNMKNFQGTGYLSWDSGTVYLHVIPYNPNAQYIGTKILKTGIGLDYIKDFHLISDYWESVSFIPPVKLCALSTGENLVLKPTVVGYEEYTVVDMLSVGKREVLGGVEGSEEETY